MSAASHKGSKELKDKLFETIDGYLNLRKDLIERAKEKDVLDKGHVRDLEELDEHLTWMVEASLINTIGVAFKVPKSVIIGYINKVLSLRLEDEAKDKGKKNE